MREMKREPAECLLELFQKVENCFLASRKSAFNVEFGFFSNRKLTLFKPKIDFFKSKNWLFINRNWILLKLILLLNKLLHRVFIVVIGNRKAASVRCIGYHQ